MTKKERFLTYCRNRYRGEGVLIVRMDIKGVRYPEFIVNKDVEAKLNYYDRAYNDELELKTCNAIAITGYAIHDKDIEELKNINLQ